MRKGHVGRLVAVLFLVALALYLREAEAPRVVDEPGVETARAGPAHPPSVEREQQAVIERPPTRSRASRFPFAVPDQVAKDMMTFVDEETEEFAGIIAEDMGMMGFGIRDWEEVDEAYEELVWARLDLERQAVQVIDGKDGTFTLMIPPYDGEPLIERFRTKLVELVGAEGEARLWDRISFALRFRNGGFGSVEQTVLVQELPEGVVQYDYTRLGPGDEFRRSRSHYRPGWKCQYADLIYAGSSRLSPSAPEDLTEW